MEKKRVTAEMLREGWVVTTADSAVGMMYEHGVGDGIGESLDEALKKHGVEDDTVIAFFYDDALNWVAVDWKDREED